MRLPRKCTAGIDFAAVLLLGALLACKPQKGKQSAAHDTTDDDVRAPTTVCGWLAAIGMAGGQWRSMVGDEWGCVSAYRSLPDGSVMAFYVTGTATAVREAYVTWNENAREKSFAAEKDFIVACNEIKGKATGVGLATAPRNAIETRESGHWQQDGVDISVEAEKLLPNASVRSVRCKVRLKWTEGK